MNYNTIFRFSRMLTLSFFLVFPGMAQQIVLKEATDPSIEIAQTSQNPSTPVGLTRDAIAINAPFPKIPYSLRGSHGLKTFVRVRFDIETDGSCQVTILTSSGLPELDRNTLEMLKEWRWKSALKDGVPVTSSRILKFNFKIE